MIALRAVPPLEAYEMWGWVRNGLLHCIEKTGAHYRPEDVYMRIRTGTAWLYVIEAKGDEIGFCVLTQEVDPDGLVLFVWALWCEPGGAAPHKHAIYDEIDKLARAIKAKRIRFWSPLRGWERERWAEKVAVIFEREL